MSQPSTENHDLNFTPCPGCGVAIHDRAPACPHCGSAIYVEHPADMTVRHKPLTYPPSRVPPRKNS